MVQSYKSTPLMHEEFVLLMPDDLLKAGTDAE